MNLELLLPELCLAGFAIALVVVDFFTQRRAPLVMVALAGLLVSAGFAVAMWGSSVQTAFNDMLAVDNFAIFFKL
ncbi:NADH-quinone oxidoreductase subunit N, partial [Chloroflexota bacterium]